MSLTIITGPMYSGKSTYLYDKLGELDNTNVLIVKHHDDTRYNSDCIVTHDKKMVKATPIKNLREIYDLVNYDVVENILIDEGQFFDNLYSFVKVALNDEKNIYISGLISDYEMNPFENLLEVLCLADTIIFKKAKCDCGDEASFSKRLVNNNKQILIGSDCYKPTCRKCFHK